MIWLIIFGAAAITFTSRFIMFNKTVSNKIPTWAENILHYVPIAVLTAIIIPEVILNPVTKEIFILDNLRLPAAIFAVIIAFFTRQVVATIGSGLIALWVLQYFF